MGSLESEIAPAMNRGLDLFGETITIQNETFDGRHPDENTLEWVEETPFDVQGYVVENQRPMEEGETATQQITGEYHIYVDSTVDVRDGRNSDEVKASVITDSDENHYDVIRVTDEHNGLYRVQATMEDP